MKRVIGHLQISCWAGFGGEHYCGTIKIDGDTTDNDWEVKHPMSAKEAKYLNKKDEISEWARYKPGTLTERFETRDELVSFAVKEFKAKYPDGILIRGSACSMSPHEIIYAPDKFKTRVIVMNKFAEEHSNLYNNYGRIEDDVRGDKLENDWNDLLESIIK